MKDISSLTTEEGAQAAPTIVGTEQPNKVSEVPSRRAPRGRTKKPTIEPLMGNASIAFQAFGLPSEAALVKKFTRKNDPWPSEFRTKDNRQWLYDIKGLYEYKFNNESE